MAGAINFPNSIFTLWKNSDTKCHTYERFLDSRSLNRSCIPLHPLCIDSSSAVIEIQVTQQSTLRYGEKTFPVAEFLVEIQTKVLRVFLLVIHSHLYSFPLRFLFLQTHETSYSFCKGEGGKPDRKPYPLPYGLRNPYRNLKFENSQDYAQKPQ